MHECQRRIVRNGRRCRQYGQLGRRAGIGLDAVYTADMQQYAWRVVGSEPRNIDGQFFVVRAARGDAQ